MENALVKQAPLIAGGVTLYHAKKSAPTVIVSRPMEHHSCLTVATGVRAEQTVLAEAAAWDTFANLEQTRAAQAPPLGIAMAVAAVGQTLVQVWELVWLMVLLFPIEQVALQVHLFPHRHRHPHHLRPLHLHLRHLYQETQGLAIHLPKITRSPVT